MAWPRWCGRSNQWTTWGLLGRGRHGRSDGEALGVLWVGSVEHSADDLPAVSVRRHRVQGESQPLHCRVGFARTGDSEDSVDDARSCVMFDGCAMASSIRWFRIKGHGPRRVGSSKGKGRRHQVLGKRNCDERYTGTSPNPGDDSADIRQVIPNVFCRSGARPGTAEAWETGWGGDAAPSVQGAGAASALVMLRRGCGADHIHNAPRTPGCADRASRRRKAEVHQAQ